MLSFSRSSSKHTVSTVSTINNVVNSSPQSLSSLSSDGTLTGGISTSASSMASINSTTATARGYNKEHALEDLPCIREVLDIFLGGQMLEAEQRCKQVDPHGQRLYPATGWGIIQALKVRIFWAGETFLAFFF